jgi:ATP-dependent Clp protease adaptor protein ClpS
MSQVVEQRVPDVVGTSERRWMVVIFNNDHTPYDSVVRVLMLATNCDMREAYIETWEAHTFGRAAVHFADRAECLAAAAIINTVGVRTAVCPEWEDA